jgi:cell division protease FtsH
MAAPVTKRGGKKARGSDKNVQKFGNSLITAFLIFMILAAGYSFLIDNLNEIEEISLSGLVAEINEGNVEEIIVKEDSLEVKFQDDVIKESKKERESSLSQTLMNYGVSSEKLEEITLKVEDPSGINYFLMNIFPFLLPILILFFFFWMASRQLKSTSTQAFSFGKSRARVVGPENQKQKITFKDVAGVKEAKEELREIVDFLKNPKKFLDIGARIPKGVLLMGAPGTGKTLLARATAGEANVPFFHISGSEFVELFVGVGASRVRDLFKMAKKAAPAIIFIDEIDAVGRHRGTGMGGGNDEREQTLNQILVEMDGFEPHEKVIVMAASNRPDVLDPALLRPGRFDRRVVLDLPDLNDRDEILKIHSKEKPFEEGVDLRIIAERTPGFSGADLQNLMNEAAIFAARQGRKKIAQDDLTSSIEKVMLGAERKSHLLTGKEKKITAYHEAGHALVASLLPNTDPVHKISVVSRGKAAGYTLKLPSEDKHLYSRAHFLDELAVSLGGYSAEKMIFGDITTGASNDIAVASDVARALATKYGMSEKIGPVSFDENDKGFVGRGMGLNFGKNYSEEMASEIDKEVTAFMKNALEKATEVLGKNKKALEAIAVELIEKETIERKEYETLLLEFGVDVRGKEEVV